jgi:hypothetical protein
MSTFAMQEPSDIEQRLLQQKRELQRLTQEMTRFLPGTPAVTALRRNGNTHSGLGCGELPSWGKEHSFRPTREDLKVNLNFSENSLMRTPSAATDSNSMNQQWQELQRGSLTSFSEPDTVSYSIPSTMSNVMSGALHRIINSSISNDAAEQKRKRLENPQVIINEPVYKRSRLSESMYSSAPAGTHSSAMSNLDFADPSTDSLDLIPPSEHGQESFGEHDVLSGRGGGTNVHPGNRYFRDLINLHRRAYLKARKNDKPCISRAIVRTIREKGGNFLKRCEKTDLWFEIGDDGAREKTSQALRQKAPEMRKLLLSTEQQLHQQKEQQQAIVNLHNGSSNMNSLMAVMAMRQQAANDNAAMMPNMISFQHTTATIGGGGNEVTINPFIGRFFANGAGTSPGDESNTP